MHQELNNLFGAEKKWPLKKYMAKLHPKKIAQFLFFFFSCVSKEDCFTEVSWRVEFLSWWLMVMMVQTTVARDGDGAGWLCP